MVRPDWSSHDHQYYVRARRRSVRGMSWGDPNSDPYYKLDREFITTLDDLGLVGYRMSYFEEEQDFDVLSPPRGAINGRCDYTSPTPTRRYIAPEIDQQEVYERDLISAYEVTIKTGADFTKIEEMFNRSTDLPTIQGWVTVDVTPRVRRSLPYYDRIEIYDWLERHNRKDLVARMKPKPKPEPKRKRTITVKDSSYRAAVAAMKKE